MVWGENMDHEISRERNGAVLEPSSGQTSVTIRLDEDIVRWYRTRAHQNGTGNYQTLINLALREYMAKPSVSLEETLRNVLMEELSHFGKNESKRRRLRKIALIQEMESASPEH